MELNQDFKEFIELLNSNEVKYIVVGGYAVGFHGYPRYTGDIDLWIAISKENTERFVDVLKKFGFAALALIPEDFQKEDLVIQFGYEPNRIDILTSVTGLNFEECYAKSNQANFEGLPIIFLDLESLKKNKSLTGRKKDLGDIENLP